MYILQSTARYETLHVWFPTARYKAVTTGEGKSSGPHSHSTLVFSSSVRRVSLHLPMQMHLLLSSGMIIGRSSYFRMVFCSFHCFLSSCWRRSCRERSSNLGWSRASQCSESQRRAVVVARVWPALLRGSSMEVLQRLGAQAPAERGHKGSRACIWRCRAFKASYIHTLWREGHNQQPSGDLVCAHVEHRRKTRRPQS